MRVPAASDAGCNPKRCHEAPARFFQPQHERSRCSLDFDDGVHLTQMKEWFRNAANEARRNDERQERRDRFAVQLEATLEAIGPQAVPSERLGVNMQTVTQRYPCVVHQDSELGKLESQTAGEGRERGQGVPRDARGGGA